MPSVMEKKEKGHPIFLSADARRRGGACLAGGGFRGVRGSRGGFRAGFRGALRAVVVAGAVLLAGGAGDLVRAQSLVCNAALGEVDDGNGNCACPSGQTGTSGNGNSSGKCVADGTALATANNCESAGWQLNDARTHCLIRSDDTDETGYTADHCKLSGGSSTGNAHGLDNNVGCEYVFTDRDGDGTPDFPAYNAALDDPADPVATPPRRFQFYCGRGQYPRLFNDAGQTQCCDSPTTDHDMNPATPCQEASAEACAAVDANAIPDPKATPPPPVACVCNPLTHAGTPGKCISLTAPTCDGAAGLKLNDDQNACICNPDTHTGTPPNCTALCGGEGEMLNENEGGDACICNPDTHTGTPAEGCVAIPTCTGEGEVLNSDKTACVCNPDTHTGTPAEGCVAIPSCTGEGEVLNSDKTACVCNSDTHTGTPAEGCVAIPSCTGEGEVLNSDKTGCVCNPATHTGTPAEGCAAGWTVRLETTGDGALRAAWSGDDDVRDGEAVPRGATVTFTATPEGDYYVAFWTGCARTEGNTGDSEDRESKECAVVAESDLSVGAFFQREAFCGFSWPRSATFGDSFRTAIQRDGECVCPPYAYDTLFGATDSDRTCLPPAGGVTPERALAIVEACRAAGNLAGMGNRFGADGETLYWVQTCDIHLNNRAIASGPGSGYSGCVIGAEPEFMDEERLPAFVNPSGGALHESDNPLVRRPDCVDVFPNLRNAGGSFPTGFNWVVRDATDGPAWHYGVAPTEAAACEVDGSCPARTVGFDLDSDAGGTLFARWSGDSDVGDGGTVPHGTTVTFSAVPEAGWYVSGWRNCGETADNIGGHSDGGTQECVRVAGADVTVGAVFSDINECETARNDCSINATCENNPVSDLPPLCECDEGFSGDGRVCYPHRVVRLDPGVGGTLSARWFGDDDLEDGDAVPHGTTVTFTATPDADYFVLGWTGCVQTSLNAGSPDDKDPKECAVGVEADLTAGVTFSDSFADACREQGMLVNSAGDACVSECPAGQEDGGGACVVCGADFYNGVAGESCKVCGVGVVGDEMNGGGTTCECDPLHGKDEGGTCVRTEREVSLTGIGQVTESGALVDSVEGLGGTLEGRSGGRDAGTSAPVSEAVTLSATPEPLWYVSIWGGACEDNGGRGSFDPPGTRQTCILPAGESAILQTVYFRRGINCSASNVEQASATTCGGCLPTFVPNENVFLGSCVCPSGESRVEAFLDAGAFSSNAPDPRCVVSDSIAAECDASGWDYLKDGDSEFCVFARDGSALKDGGSGKSSGRCVISGDGTADDPLCADAFPAGTIPDKAGTGRVLAHNCPFGSFLSLDRADCVWTVSVDAAADGTLSAGWSGNDDVRDGGTIPVGITLTFTASPSAGFYVSGWTGDCDNNATATTGEGDPTGTAQSCEVAGDGNISAGVVFSPEKDCAGLGRPDDLSAATVCGECPEGTTGTSGNANSTGACVADDSLDVANACEAAGWALGVQRNTCMIPLYDHTPDEEGAGEFCGLATGCAYFFADTDGDSVPDFPVYNAALDDEELRQFSAYCQKGELPAGRNDAGQSQCCAPPSVDHDGITGTACQVSVKLCAGEDPNSVPATDLSRCLCPHGGSFPNCRAVSFGILPAGLPETGDIADVESGCVLLGGTFSKPNAHVSFCELPGGVSFEGEAFTIEDARDCAVARRPVTGSGKDARCGDVCPDGEVVRENVCGPGIFDQCDERPGVCGALEICMDDDEAEHGTTAALCSCVLPNKLTAGGTCVVAGVDDINVKIANNCESAGWTVRTAIGEDGTGTQYCDIPHYDENGAAAESCEIDGKTTGSCHSYFAADAEGAADFPTGSATADRYVSHCRSHSVRGGSLTLSVDASPHPKNDGGQTHCCVLPTTDHDGDPTTECEATTATCAAADGIPDPADATRCLSNNVVVRLAVPRGNGGLSARWAGDSDVGDGETVPRGTRVTFTATPNGGYYVSGWTGCAQTADNVGSVSSPTPKECATEVGAELTVEAAFAPTLVCAGGMTLIENYQTYSQRENNTPGHICVASDSLAADCFLSGWHYSSTNNDNIGQCYFDRDGGSARNNFHPDGVSLKNFLTDERSSRCGLGNLFALQCADIFGSDIPDAADTGQVIVYNCPAESSDPADDYSTCNCKDGFSGEQCEISQTCADQQLYVHPERGDCVTACPDGYQKNPEVFACEHCDTIKTNSVSYNGGEPCSCSVTHPIESFDGTSCHPFFSVACNSGEYRRDIGNGLYKCSICDEGEYYPSGGVCTSCGNGDTGGVGPTGGATTCACHPGNVKVGGTCFVSNRTVSISVSPEDGSGGTVVAASGGSEVANGGIVLGTLSATLTAVPEDDGWYVSGWTGDCDTPDAGVGGGDATGGLAKTCVVGVGVSDINAGAVFEEVADCAGENRESGTASSCGGCLPDYGIAAGGDPDVCVRHWTVVLTPGVNGTLSARWHGDDDLRSGERVPDGTAVTLVADPDDLHFVSGWTGCAETAANVGRAGDFGNKECVVAVGSDLSAGATFSGLLVESCRGSGEVLNSAGNACVSECPAGQEDGGGQCVACGADSYNGVAGESCKMCGAGVAGGEQNGGATTCLCSFLHEKDSGGTCVRALRTVRAGMIPVDGSRGAVSVSSGGRAVGTTAPIGSGVTLSAVPAGADFYVSEWTGDCAGVGETGEDAPGGTERFCVLGAGSSGVNAGVVFSEVLDCGAESRVRKTATSCGVCAEGYYWDGGACTDDLFDASQGAFNSLCVAAGGNAGLTDEVGSGSEGVMHVGGSGGRVAALSCVGFGGTSDSCYLILDPAFDPAAESLYDRAGNGPYHSPGDDFPRCDVVFAGACAAYEERPVSGNRLSGCRTTDATCRSVNGDWSATSDGTACECAHLGTLPNCSPPVREVAVSAEGSGVVAGWTEVWVGGETTRATLFSGDSRADALAGSEVVVVARPEVYRDLLGNATVYYVSGWTGSCAGSPDGREDSAVRVKRCVVPAGESDVSAGVVFSPVVECGGENRVRESLSSCGECAESFVESGGVCVACDVAGATSSGGVCECDLSAGFVDPNPGDGVLECGCSAGDVLVENGNGGSDRGRTAGCFAPTDAAAKCVAAGWSWSSRETGAGTTVEVCDTAGGLLFRHQGAGSENDFCVISGDVDGPGCAEVFGAGFDFPQRGGAAAEFYVYACGENAGVDAANPTRCACDDGYRGVFGSPGTGTGDRVCALPVSDEDAVRAACVSAGWEFEEERRFGAAVFPARCDFNQRNNDDDSAQSFGLRDAQSPDAGIARCSGGYCYCYVDAAGSQSASGGNAAGPVCGDAFGAGLLIPSYDEVSAAGATVIVYNCPSGEVRKTSGEGAFETCEVGTATTPAEAEARVVNIVQPDSGGGVAGEVDGTVIAHGETAPAGHAVTFTATPADDGFYVREWTGDCAGSESGLLDTVGGRAKVCVVPAGTGSVNVGVAMESVVDDADCAGLYRERGRFVSGCGDVLTRRVVLSPVSDAGTVTAELDDSGESVGVYADGPTVQVAPGVSETAAATEAIVIFARPAADAYVAEWTGACADNPSAVIDLSRGSDGLGLGLGAVQSCVVESGTGEVVAGAVFGRYEDCGLNGIVRDGACACPPAQYKYSESGFSGTICLSPVGGVSAERAAEIAVACDAGTSAGSRLFGEFGSDGIAYRAEACPILLTNLGVPEGTGSQYDGCLIGEMPGYTGYAGLDNPLARSPDCVAVFPNLRNSGGTFPEGFSGSDGARYEYGIPPDSAAACEPDNSCPARAVSLGVRTGGTLRASWSGDDDVGDGGTVPHGTTVTFSASPDAGWYVSGWRGCAASAENIGGHSDGGVQECAVLARANVSVAALFSDIDECETVRNECSADATCENDARVSDAPPICECKEGFAGDGRMCGVARTMGVEWTGNGTLSARRAGDDDVRDGEDVPDGALVTFVATPDSGHYVFGWTGCAETAGNVGSPSDGGRKECAVVVSGAGLTVTAEFSGTERRRSVGLSRAGFGAVWARAEVWTGTTVTMTTIYGGDSQADVLADFPFTVEARPEVYRDLLGNATVYYVSGWTGSCVGSPDGTGDSAVRVKRCVVPAGESDVSAGVVFSPVVECAGENRVRESLSSCGGCADSFVESGGVCVACDVAGATSSGGVCECDLSAGFVDPNPGDGVLECGCSAGDVLVENGNGGSDRGRTAGCFAPTDAAAKCVAAGWSWSSRETGAGTTVEVCDTAGGLLFRHQGAGSENDFCVISGDADGPGCAEVFGAGFDFPQRGGAAEFYVYACGENAGADPANPTRCACDDGYRGVFGSPGTGTGDDVCAPPLSDEDAVRAACVSAGWEFEEERRFGAAVFPARCDFNQRNNDDDSAQSFGLRDAIDSGGGIARCSGGYCYCYVDAAGSQSAAGGNAAGPVCADAFGAGLLIPTYAEVVGAGATVIVYNCPSGEVRKTSGEGAFETCAVGTATTPAEPEARVVNIAQPDSGGGVAGEVNGTVIVHGETAAAGHAVTFTATPADDGFYVREWTGDCAGSESGLLDTVGGLAKVCVVPAGTGSVNVGVAMGTVVDDSDCASLYRERGRFVSGCGDVLTRRVVLSPVSDAGTVTAESGGESVGVYVGAVAVPVTREEVSPEGVTTTITELAYPALSGSLPGWSETALATDAVTFTAWPAVGYYVSDWTGACASDAVPPPVLRTTGEGDDAGGVAKICVVAAGTSEASAGPVLSPVRDCGSENREDADGVLVCGVCSVNYEDYNSDGDCTACDSRIAGSVSEVGGSCGCVSGTITGSSLSFLNSAGDACVNRSGCLAGEGPDETGRVCSACVGDTFNPTAGESCMVCENGGTVGDVVNGGFTTCACAGDYTGTTCDTLPDCPDNSSRATDADRCVCDVYYSPASGSPDSGTDVVCELDERSVSVSVSDNGSVVATVSGVEVGEGGSAESSAAVPVTFVATPDASYYVTVWTGACAGLGTTGESDAPGTSQSCVVSAGSGDIAAGAAFAEAAPCGSRNRIQADATTCGACIDDHETTNPADANNGEATCNPVSTSGCPDNASEQGGFCVCDANFMDPNVATPTAENPVTECRDVVACDATAGYESADNGTACVCPTGTTEVSGGGEAPTTRCIASDSREAACAAAGWELRFNRPGFKHTCNFGGSGAIGSKGSLELVRYDLGMAFTWTLCEIGGTNTSGENPGCGVGLTDDPTSTDYDFPANDKDSGTSLLRVFGCPDNSGQDPNNPALCVCDGGFSGELEDPITRGSLTPEQREAANLICVSDSPTCDAPGETLNEAGDACAYTDESCGGAYDYSEANDDNTGCRCRVSGGTLGSCAAPPSASDCPAGRELNSAGTACVECVADENNNPTYNPTPGGSCMVCGDNGTRMSATVCDCDSGYAKGASGECVVASPRAEISGVAVDELTAAPTDGHFVEEWVGVTCANDGDATGDADNPGAMKVCELSSATSAEATVGVVYSYSRTATLGTVPADGTGGTVYATVAAAVPEELSDGDRVSSREFVFVVAVPAAGWRVASWGEAGGVCKDAPTSQDENDTGAKVCVIRPGDDDLNVGVTFESVSSSDPGL